MAYATYQQLVNLFGAKRLLNATPDSDVETIEERWSLYLSAASAEIDTALLRQGYVLPFDLTGQDDAAALLAATCIPLALEQGAPALVATPEGVKSAVEVARARLNDWATGARRLPFAIGQQLFASVERVVRGDADPLIPFDDRIFRLMEVSI